MATWANLPSDLLISISDRLDSLNCLRLSAVCTNWAFIIQPRLPTFPRFRLDQPIPWHLINTCNSYNNCGHTDFTFYDLTTYTAYCITSPIPFTLNGPRWIGSNFGRLVCIDDKSQLHLISPLTGDKQLLPSVKLPHDYEGNLNAYWDARRNTLKFHSHEKVILGRVSGHSSGNNNGLLLLCFFQPHGLAVLKVGDNKWTWLDLEKHYKDAIVYQGKIYAMTDDTLYCWEDEGSSFRAGKVVLTIKNSILNNFRKYLVESGGKLLMVCRNKGRGNAMNMYELDLDQGRRLLSSVKSIGDKAVFMGLDYCRIASTIGLDSAERNCIYYFDECCNDNDNKYHFLAVYNFKKKTYVRFPMNKSYPTPWFWPCDVK
ncbi:F-box protein At2g17036-like [Carex rostrata]